ncbi:response regulator [Paenibacillus psychroresistens]|uniref:Response regulator n=1 Tax=Paenibacillus psychroresistens TaxID=1778678 RepID=A0A6B8REL6_9BACL|nr:response regulator [Paenibacillus psychroresistens]QGQ93995.1 response regulator [Paenibacillus psychroresistens]
MYDLRILLCDDSLLVRKKLKDSLTKEGFKNVFEAVDGEEAVIFCQNERPDLVLLDLIMPKKDGMQALEEIKQGDASIYVVIASSVGTQSNLIKSIKLGADDFLQKPITIESIVTICKKIIEQRGV